MSVKTNMIRSKDKDWRQKFDYTNLKDLDYQVDKADKADETDEIGETDEKDETDKEEKEAISEWVKVTKGRFDVIRGVIIRAVNDGLNTRVDNKNITLNNAKK